MSNYLPTEEQKALLIAKGWEPEDNTIGTSQSWTKDQDEIVFVPDEPPAAYGYDALAMLEILKIVPGEVEIEGDVRRSAIDGLPVPAIFNGKRVKVRLELTSI